MKRYNEKHTKTIAMNHNKVFIAFEALLISLLLVIIQSCNSGSAPTVIDDPFASPADSDTGGNTGGNTGGSVGSLTFNGLNNIVTFDDQTATLTWSSYSGAALYNIFDVTGGSVSFLTTVSSASTTYTVTGLIPGQTYTYRVRVMDSEGNFDTNTVNKNVTTNIAPNAPTSVSLSNPSTYPSTVLNPTIEISGIKSGDIIKLYTDSSCTQNVGSETASSGTVQITSSNLEEGAYSLYATATNSEGNESVCSSAFASYEIVLPQCPEGYIDVPAYPSVDITSNFCVMKYEASYDGSGNAVSVASATPPSSMSASTAKSKCTSLGAKYDLLSNAEFMAIARNIEQQDINWVSGTVGVGCLKKGMVKSDSACGEIGSGTDKRIFVLSNGQEIWDIAGGKREWVDWIKGGTLAGVYSLSSLSNVDISFVSHASLDNKYFNTENGNYNQADNGVGVLSIGGSGNYYVQRGGFKSNLTGYDSLTTGLFYMYAASSSSATNDTYGGFRCVYRP
ncbi:MAG: fibronectin type III domain-containing protein [Halobacteriovoraceae bacterium]|nr:fibronectin type III domain-containing protein [Halobacteriovoraceae bacterium]